MGIKMALDEMFPLAPGAKTWSYVVTLLYFVQLVRNSSPTDGGLAAVENVTSSVLFLTSTPEQETDSLPSSVHTNSNKSNLDTVDEDINHTILKNNSLETLYFDSDSSRNYSDNDVNDTSSSSTSASPTKKAIYIRGHLLQSHTERTFRPPHPKQGDFLRPDNPQHRAFLKNFREEPAGGTPGCEEGKVCPQQQSAPNIINHIGSPVRRKKKHSTYHGRKKFHNYKLLYDTIRNTNDLHQKETEFYAWIFGAAMLTLGSLTTLASCFVFCFCGDKWRKRREMRRRFDKSGEYQRVDSVSSIVDNNAHHEELYEDQLDSVTII